MRHPYMEEHFEILAELERRNRLEHTRLAVIRLSEKMGIMFHQAERIYNMAVAATQEVIPEVNAHLIRTKLDSGMWAWTPNRNNYLIDDKNKTIH